MDLQKAQTLISGIEEDAKLVQQLIDKLNLKIQSFEGQDEAGIGLLHLKNIQLADYMSNLSYLIATKANGKSIADDSAIERIVEIRTVLEKVRPIEKKLKYQMDKFTRLAEDNLEASDPLHFKPNLADLDADDDGSEDEEEGGGSAEKETKKYQVPKHVPALPDDDLTRQDIENEEKSKAKKKTLSKSIIEDLKRQYADTPEEEYHRSGNLKAKHVADMRDRARYEEDNYMRLPTLSKREKHKQRKSMTTMGTVADELTYFGRDNFFNDEQRKRKSSSKKSSAKKKFRKK